MTFRSVNPQVKLSLTAHQSKRKTSTSFLINLVEVSPTRNVFEKINVEEYGQADITECQSLKLLKLKDCHSVLGSLSTV